MSRSPDNLNGTNTQCLLSDEERANAAAAAASDDIEGVGGMTLPSIPASPGHRKTQSLLATSTSGGGGRAGRAGRHRARHHRHRSSIGELLESISEGVQAEARVLRSTWIAELEDGDLGRRYFLDMAMTRSLSVLPEDISEFADEAVLHRSERRSSINPLLDGPPPEPIPRTPTASLGSFAALLSAVFAVSSNGSALAMLHDVHPAMKLFWRMTAVAALLSVFAIQTMVKQHRESQQFLPKLTLSQWLTFGAAAVCFFLHTLLLFTALTLTSIGNAVIGANSQALLLVIGKVLSGQKVVLLEGLGVVLAFAGCILCAGDEAKGDGEDNDGDGIEDLNSKAILGDVLALASAVTGVCYLTFAKAVRSHMPVTLFMFMVMLSGCFLCLMYIFALGIPYSFDNNPHTGLFGWATLVNQHIFIILYVGVICNMVGTMGFVRAMEYFDNIIIAVATLLEPMLATLIAFALGVGDLPGTMGWIGNLLVALGTLGVVYPSVHDKSGGGGGH